MSPVENTTLEGGSTVEITIYGLGAEIVIDELPNDLIESRSEVDEDGDRPYWFSSCVDDEGEEEQETEWYNLDSLFHACGGFVPECNIEIIVDGKVLIDTELTELIDTGKINCDHTDNLPEYKIKKDHSLVLACYPEKGQVFRHELRLAEPFDLRKLTIGAGMVNLMDSITEAFILTEVITEVKYDGIELDDDKDGNDPGNPFVYVCSDCYDEDEYDDEDEYEDEDE